MNYLKWGIYSLLFAFFFYPLMEMASFNGSIFSERFFSLTGFIAVFLYALANIYQASYSIEYGKKKDAEEAASK